MYPVEGICDAEEKKNIVQKSSEREKNEVNWLTSIDRFIFSKILYRKLRQHYLGFLIQIWIFIFLNVWYFKCVWIHQNQMLFARINP